MKINLNEINRKDFNISKRELNNSTVYLINPEKSKHRWLETERHMKSVLCDSDGRILCSGFKKFENYRAHPELDLITQKSIMAGKAWFTEKMDGSLIIRTIIDGKVNFRTRGNHTLGDFEIPVMNLIKSKYPELLNSKKDARYSLLFEYTSSDNLIVIKYNEPQLTVLGMMDLTAEPPEFLSSPDLLDQLEKDYETPAVKFHKFGQDVNWIIEKVSGWKNKEGIVVWCPLSNGHLHLCKIKTSEYIKLHSFKFNMTKEKVKQFCWIKDINNLNHLKSECFKVGVDWEVVSYIEVSFNEYIERKNNVWKEVQQFISKIESEDLNALLTRKEKALRLKKLANNNALFSLGIKYLFDNKNIQANIDAMILEISVNQLPSIKKEAAELVNSWNEFSY